jgi:serine/threonine-protein phosphatase 5
MVWLSEKLSKKSSGGLPLLDQPEVDELRKIDRTVKLPPPSKREGDSKRIEEILWSDPKEDITGIEPSSRGAGLNFGADVTETFLERNNLSLLIRY